jgi:hypothetical protein
MRALVLYAFLVLLLLTSCGRNGDLDKEQIGVSGGHDGAEIPSGPAGALSQEQILENAWTSLEPNTSSHTRENWEAVQVRKVAGQEVAEEFEGDPSAGCWMGPTPVPNVAIDASQTYWYVKMAPKSATPVPQERTISPTEPPAIPEPFLYQAHFLLDLDSGRVVARKLMCVIY